MSQTAEKIVAICFDGTSAEQLPWLRKNLPALDKYFGDKNICLIDSSPFVEPQPIWAEVLTGAPWYRNGCAGYAHPVDSLNNMQIFREQDLLEPIQFFKSHKSGKAVLINVPLLQPKDDERIWLGDGNIPGLKHYSPAALKHKIPKIEKFTSRPFLSMGEAMADTAAAIDTYVDVELNRLNLAKSIDSELDWTFFLYRTNIFDQLFHLLGDDLLTTKKLRFTKKLTSLFTQLDETLAPLVMRSDRSIAFSTFSHTRCRALFSLNNAFEDARLLKREQKNLQGNSLRKQALTAARGTEVDDDNVQLTETFTYIPRKTLCASPMRSVIYINGSDKFADGGNVDDDQLALEEKRIETFFRTLTSTYFTNVTLIKSPARESKAPNFCFQIEGVELVESLQGLVQSTNLPGSTHKSVGWLWSPKVDKEITSVHSTEVVNFV